MVPLFANYENCGGFSKFLTVAPQKVTSSERRIPLLVHNFAGWLVVIPDMTLMAVDLFVL